MSNKLFITGIGTNIGKTIVGAILRKASHAAYWKPIQAGDLHELDSEKVRALSAVDAPILEERFLLNTPASPHFAAEKDGIHLTIDDFELPDFDGNLLIEGAGGLLVPLNNEGLVLADVLKKWDIPVVVISRHYLGSINHTLLTLEYLKVKHIPVKALIFVGAENKATESAILTAFPQENWCRVDEAKEINQDFIAEQAKKISFNLFD